MAEFSNESSLLYMRQIQEEGERTDAPSWVYYKKLEETNSSFYNIVNERLSGVFSGDSFQAKRKESAAKLYAMAQVEKNKEISLLKEMIGIDMKVDLEDPNDIKEFVNTFQDLLQYKGIADRSKLRLEKGEKHISIAPFLEKYLLDNIEKDIAENLNEYAQYLYDPREFFSFFVKRLQGKDGIWEKTAIDLGNSNNLSNQNDSGKGYYKFFQDLLKRPEVLKRFFWDINNDISFTKLAKEIYENMQPNVVSDNLKTIFSKRKNSNLKFVTGGKIQETLVAYTQELLMSKKIPNVVFNARQVGGKEARPDVISSVGLNFPIGEIEKEFKEMKDASREEARLAAIRIHERLQKVDKGFLIYTNVKNYGLSSDTHFKGTENMKLQQYYSLLSEIQDTRKLSQFVTAIMNTLRGAIAEEKKEEISSLIAQDLAYFLFDDYETIGKELSRSANAIHMFMLSDFYVPLSLLLQLLAKSFDDLEDNPKKYGSITIYSGKIKYPNGPWGMEEWREQRRLALKEIELGIRFFNNFKTWIEEQML